MSRKKQKVVDRRLLEGLEITKQSNNHRENRVYTLLLKGIIAYLVTAGIFGCALSTTQSSFSHILFNAVVLILSLLISLFYYNKKTENWCDIAYLVVLIFVGVKYAKYINTGFYSWMNDIVGTASVYFDLPQIGGYAAKTDNIPVALTFAACYLGAVGAIIVNMSIIKKMHFLDLIVDIIIVMFLPAYLELEPGFYYTTILVLGLLFSVIWCLTGKYEKVDDNDEFAVGSKGLEYVYNWRAHIYGFAQLGIVAFLILVLFFVVFPKDDYKLLRSRSDTKGYTDDIIETFITSGIYGFFNRYDNTGGMSSGRLGGVNSIRFDYEKDLEITFVPSGYGPVYLRTFVGSEYVPYSNRWEAALPSHIFYEEYDAMKELYDGGYDKSARGYMKIDNIDAEFGEYNTYYCNKHDRIHSGNSYTETYYPRIDETVNYGSEISLDEDEKQYWLHVPNDNKPSIISFVQKLGLETRMDELEATKIIYDYFYNNVPYTLRPGSTPWRKDFVNYFLDSNKKGYCAHFASAATLAFRQIGIPARYVEGYAFDYYEVLEGEAQKDAAAADYYDGYNELGDGTGVVRLSLSDANAHAWVEIYTDEFGWIPVELTPPSSDTETDRSSFMENFMKLFMPDNDYNENDFDFGNNMKFDNRKLRYFFIGLFAVIVLSAVALVIGRIVLYALKYCKADINGKLIMRYHTFLVKKSKRYDAILDKHNYRDQILYLYGDSCDCDKLDQCIGILEKAGFSNKEITSEEFDYVLTILKTKINIGKDKVKK